ncbi:MAG: L,D-transpeptidase family protein [Negativicutes bacterium]|nr:L,D-transpeptidase family protein [Negativicutes bacterium]
MINCYIRKPRMYLSAIALIVVGFFAVLTWISYWEERELAAIPNQPQVCPQGKISIVIKIPSRILEVHEDGKVYKKYRIAVGKSDTPSPLGEWVIAWKSYRPGDIFGTRFLALNVPWGGYGIHGTNQPWSIGHSASKGCIRMRNKDIEELYEWIPIGTPVRIEGYIVRIQRTLKIYDMGIDVVKLQRKLRELGYLEGRADGFFNKDTEEAVKRFQHDRGLKVTGIVDKSVLNLLGI